MNLHTVRSRNVTSPILRIPSRHDLKSLEFEHKPKGPFGIGLRCQSGGIERRTSKRRSPVINALFGMRSMGCSLGAPIAAFTTRFKFSGTIWILREKNWRWRNRSSQILPPPLLAMRWQVTALIDVFVENLPSNARNRHLPLLVTLSFLHCHQEIFQIHICHLKLQALVQAQPGVEHEHRHRMNPALLTPMRFELNDMLNLSLVQRRNHLR